MLTRCGTEVQRTEAFVTEAFDTGLHDKEREDS